MAALLLPSPPFTHIPLISSVFLLICGAKNIPTLSYCFFFLSGVLEISIFYFFGLLASSRAASTPIPWLYARLCYVSNILMPLISTF
jgi:hypothetical protein